MTKRDKEKLSAKTKELVKIFDGMKNKMTGTTRKEMQERLEAVSDLIKNIPVAPTETTRKIPKSNGYPMRVRKLGDELSPVKGIQ